MATDCTARITRLTALMDDADKNRFDPLRDKTGISPDTYWRTVNGHALQMVGPGTPELNTSDFISLFSRVQRYGEGGRDLSDGVKRAQELSRINSSAYQWRALEFVKDFTPEENLNWYEVMFQRSARGLQPGERMPPPGSRKIDPMNDRVRAAAEFLNSKEGSGGLLDHLASIADRDGLLQERLSNYGAPIMYPTELLDNAEFKNNAHNSLAREQANLRLRKAYKEQLALGKKPTAPSPATDADLIPDDIANAKLIFDRFVMPQYAVVAPHLELSREWDVAGAITDPKVLIPVYIQQMWRRIAEKRIFGARDHLHGYPEKMTQQLGQIASEHGDKAYKEAFILAKDFVGIHPDDPVMHSTIVRTLSNMQGLKLTMSALRNLTQQTSTALRGDFGSLAKAWGLYAKDGQLQGYSVRELAKDIGAAADLTLYDSTLYRAEDRFGRGVARVLEYTGFTPIERYNRTFTGIAGAVYAEKQAKKLLDGSTVAIQRLKELGIDPDAVRRQGGISHQDMLLAGRRFIDETQFTTRSGELPFFAQTPMWRFLLQFRTFAINQTRFILREAQRGLSDPSTSGKVKRLGRQMMYATAVMPAAGFAVDVLNDLQAEILPWFEPRQRNKRSALEGYLESWAGAGSFGVISDLAWASYLSGESKMFANYFTPPGIGTLNDMTAIMGEVGRGKGSQATRDFFRQFGGLGAAFGRYVAPPKERRNQRSTLDELEEWLAL